MPEQVRTDIFEISLTRIKTFDRVADEIIRLLDPHGRADRPITLVVPPAERFDGQRLVEFYGGRLRDRFRLDDIHCIRGRRPHEIEDDLRLAYMDGVDGIIVKHAEALSRRTQEMFLEYAYPFGPLTLFVTDRPPTELVGDGAPWSSAFGNVFERRCRLAWPAVTELAAAERLALFQYGVAKRAFERQREPPHIENRVCEAVGRRAWTAAEGARTLIRVAAACVDLVPGRRRASAGSPTAITADMLAAALR